MNPPGEPRWEVGDGVATRSSSSWWSAEAEAEAYEGIRRGDEAAFRAVALPLQPVLRRLAGLTADHPAEIDRVVVRTWESTLRGLDMFRWNTSFAVWIAKGTVAQSRSLVTDPSWPNDQPAPRLASGGVVRAPGPDDWSDLPWAPRWEGALDALERAQASLSLPEREVVLTRDVDHWPSQRVCEVFGLPGASYVRLLGQARGRLRDALAPLVGEPGDPLHRDVQVARTAEVLGLLAWSPDDPGADRLDRGTLMAFRRWRARRVPRWRRLRTHVFGPQGADALLA